MFLPHLRQSAYSVFLKPFFLSLDPETAHELAKNFLGIGQKFPGFLTLMESMTSYQSDRLKTKSLESSLKILWEWERVSIKRENYIPFFREWVSVISK